MKRGNFWGKGRPLQSIELSAVSCAEMAEPIDLPFVLWTQVGRRRTSSIVFARWRQCTQRHSDVSCAKTAKPMICRLVYGRWWAEGSTSSIIFTRWRQCANMGGHIVGMTEPSVCGGDACSLMSNYFDHLSP